MNVFLILCTYFVSASVFFRFLLENNCLKILFPTLPIILSVMHDVIANTLHRCTTLLQLNFQNLKY